MALIKTMYCPLLLLNMLMKISSTATFVKQKDTLAYYWIREMETNGCGRPWEGCFRLGQHHMFPIPIFLLLSSEILFWLWQLLREISGSGSVIFLGFMPDMFLCGQRHKAELPVCLAGLHVALAMHSPIILETGCVYLSHNYSELLVLDLLNFNVRYIHI